MASQRDYQPPELLSMEASRVVQLKLGDAHTEPPILAYGLPATWQHKVNDDGLEFQQQTAPPKQVGKFVPTLSDEARPHCLGLLDAHAFHHTCAQQDEKQWQPNWS